MGPGADGVMFPSTSQVQRQIREVAMCPAVTPGPSHQGPRQQQQRQHQANGLEQVEPLEALCLETCQRLD